MVGLGGVLTELLSDVSHRLVPVTQAEAEGMIDELAGRPLLDGYRGRPGADVAQLANVLVAVSALLADHEDIAQLDINPLVADPGSGPSGEPSALLALDALVVLETSLASTKGDDHG
jgi:succinyl-CoA synthetase beta subunit